MVVKLTNGCIGTVVYGQDSVFIGSFRRICFRNKDGHLIFTSGFVQEILNKEEE